MKQAMLRLHVWKRLLIDMETWHWLGHFTWVFCSFMGFDGFMGLSRLSKLKEVSRQTLTSLAPSLHWELNVKRTPVMLMFIEGLPSPYWTQSLLVKFVCSIETFVITNSVNQAVKWSIIDVRFELWKYFIEGWTGITEFSSAIVVVPYKGYYISMHLSPNAFWRKNGR